MRAWNGTPNIDISSKFSRRVVHSVNVHVQTDVACGKEAVVNRLRQT